MGHLRCADFCAMSALPLIAANLLRYGKYRDGQSSDSCAATKPSGFEVAAQTFSSLSSPLASFRSSVSNPSVNQPQTRASR
jgi:hypothetical protein